MLPPDTAPRDRRDELHAVMGRIGCGQVVIAVCSLFAGTFLLMMRTRLDALVALTAALAIFSISHFVLRQPIVWFALALSLILGSERARPLRAHTEH